LTDDDRQRAAENPVGGDSAPAAPTSVPADAPAGAGAIGPAAEPALAEDATVTDPAQPAGEDAAPAKGKGKKRTTWLDDLKAIFWLLLAVLVFHSCVAKPFYIPSESMMPGLLKGDRLVVSKFPYGWSWVSPSFHIFPRWQGRIWGAMPHRGDIVIVTPPDSNSDYIKRVIGLPGDTIQVIDGQLMLNGRLVRREARPDAMIPIDANIECQEADFVRRVRRGDRQFCQMRVFREYLPDGDGLRAYDTIDTGWSPADDFGPYRVREGHVFLMGDNRDDSADSRVALQASGLGGGVPWENIGGRAEFITFSLDGSSSYWNPISWFTALRGGRAGSSLHPTSEPARQNEGQNQGQNQGAPRP
jgi:signal peptidase I